LPAPAGRDRVGGWGVDLDPSWRTLYRVGAFAAFAYILAGIVAPALVYMPVGYVRGMDGHGLLTFIAEHRTWWLVLQTLTLGPAFLTIPSFLAIFVALKDANKSWAAIGASLAIGCQLLFASFYPGTLGLTYLSDQYVAAPSRRQSLAAAAEGVTAPLDAYNPLYETVFAVGILILSLVMLRSAFPRPVAWLGIAAACSEVLGVSVISWVGMGYFWWWLVFAVWFAAAGWRLVQEGRGNVPGRVSVGGVRQ
jgi:hypothetical protein